VRDFGVFLVLGRLVLGVGLGWFWVVGGGRVGLFLLGVVDRVWVGGWGVWGGVLGWFLSRIVGVVWCVFGLVGVRLAHNWTGIGSFFGYVCVVRTFFRLFWPRLVLIGGGAGEGEGW
jgi:hypothetical protein